MCGICGVVAADRPSDRRSAVVAACNAIRHRGPDHGVVAQWGRCTLGNRRLRVIDLATGDQPVENEDGSVVAVFNGELYNFGALRADLGGKGHVIRGTGDTPTIPHLYEEHGERFVERLDGMFALALWDGGRERLVLARDRFGKKPLLWTQLRDGSLAFASELKALLTFPGVDRTVGLDRIDAYLALGYVPGADTAMPAIHRLPPGHLLVAEGGEIRVERYWELRAPEQVSRSDEEWLELVRAGVRGAVRKRLVSDVPLGALLSGGIDSSIVVAVMAQETTEPVRTFSIGFGDQRYDERRYARAVAERYGTVHEELLVEPDAAALIPRLAEAYDEPFGDTSALPTFLVCEHARSRVTVALVGDGGDEIFGGYERYRAHALADRLARVPTAVTAGAARVIRLIPAARTTSRSTVFRVARFLDTIGLDPTERYAHLIRLTPAEIRDGLWSPEAHAALGGGATRAATLLGPPRARGMSGLQLLDVATYLPDDLLYKADIASMAHSLELRAPLLDHGVAELALGLPEHLRFDGRTGKVALRRAFAADLPPAIATRGKSGFGVPIAAWFREDLRDLARDVLLGSRARSRGWFEPRALEQLLAEHATGKTDHGERIWALMMLELWLERYVDGHA